MDDPCSLIRVCHSLQWNLSLFLGDDHLHFQVVTPQVFQVFLVLSKMIWVFSGTNPSWNHQNPFLPWHARLPDFPGDKGCPSFASCWKPLKLPVPVAASYAMMFIQLHQLKPEFVCGFQHFFARNWTTSENPWNLLEKLVEDCKFP